jgi:hypothetical protein
MVVRSLLDKVNFLHIGRCNWGTNFTFRGLRPAHGPCRTPSGAGSLMLAARAADARRAGSLGSRASADLGALDRLGYGPVKIQVVALGSGSADASASIGCSVACPPWMRTS